MREGWPVTLQRTEYEGTGILAGTTGLKVGETMDVIPADLGRELYEALDDAIAHNVNATKSDSAGWTQEAYDAWDAARARYEREVSDGV